MGTKAVVLIVTKIICVIVLAAGVPWLYFVELRRNGPAVKYNRDDRAALDIAYIDLMGDDEKVSERRNRYRYDGDGRVVATENRFPNLHPKVERVLEKVTSLDSELLMEGAKMEFEPLSSEDKIGAWVQLIVLRPGLAERIYVEMPSFARSPDMYVHVLALMSLYYGETYMVDDNVFYLLRRDLMLEGTEDGYFHGLGGKMGLVSLVGGEFSKRGRLALIEFLDKKPDHLLQRQIMSYLRQDGGG